METIEGVLRVVGGCGITVLMFAFFVAVTVLLPMFMAVRLCAFVPMAKRRHAEPQPVPPAQASSPSGDRPQASHTRLNR